MNSNKLFSFRTPTSNKDYLSLYRWVKSSNNDNSGNNSINLKDSMSGILSKIADHPVVKLNKGKNQLSSHESIECNALYLELLENISDVFTKMPNYLLNQLPGYTKDLENDIKNALSKLKILQNTVSEITNPSTKVINNCNIQSTIGNDLNETTHFNDIGESMLLERQNIIKEPDGVINANINTVTVNIDNDDVSEVNHLPSTSYADMRHSYKKPPQDPHSVGNSINTYIKTINNGIDGVSEDNNWSSISYASNRLRHIEPPREQQSVTNNVNTYVEPINIDKDNVSEVIPLPSTSYANKRHSYIEPQQPHSVVNSVNTFIETINIDNDDVSEANNWPLSSYASNRHSHIEHPREPQSVTNKVNTYITETINIDKGNVSEVNLMSLTSYANKQHSYIEPPREPHSVTNNVNTYIETINIDENNVSRVNHLPSTSYATKQHSYIKPPQEPHSVVNSVNTYIKTINIDSDDVSEVNNWPSTSYASNRHRHIEPPREPQSVTNKVNTYIETINIDKDNVSDVDHLPSTSYCREPPQEPLNLTNNVKTCIESINIHKDDVSNVNHLPSTSHAGNRHSHIEPRDQINHRSSNRQAENTDPDTNHKKIIDNSVFSKDIIYPKLILKSNFRLQNFRENQLEAINAARFGHNCFIVMPPGGGKSLCYQMSAILSSGVTVVVSPLSSLILDEIEYLKSLKVIDEVAHLEGKLGHRAETLTFKKLSMDKPVIKLLYVTPEKLMMNEILVILDSLHEKGFLTRFVIDEAQCVLQWDVGFRGAYYKLHELCAKFNTVPVTALTSCATKNTMNDIQIQLGMTDSIIFCTSLNLPNISYNISNKDEINGFDEHVAMMIHDKYKNQSGILYCLTNEKCKEMVKILTKKGITAIACLTNMNEKAKRNVESYWLSNNCKVICATNPYDISKNKPDVRFIVHYSLPPSIESYYQGTSCAGRDGSNAECYLFYSPRDIQTNVNIFTELNFYKFDPNFQIINESRQRQLMEMYEFCTDKQNCRRLALLKYFNNKYSSYDCGAHNACDYCRNKMEELYFEEECPLFL